MELQHLKTISNSCRPLSTIFTIGEKWKAQSYVDRGSHHGIRLPVAFQRREISISVPLSGKHNFRKFYLGNKRGDRNFKKSRRENPELYPDPDLRIESEVKDVGYKYGRVHRVVPEMIPELIVPDLTDCKLKPYVSYRVADIVQQEFSPNELFGYVYQSKIEEDFKNGKLDADGNPLEPSIEEKLDAERAYLLARRTGSDIFSERIPKLWECLENYELEEGEKDWFFYPPASKERVKVKEIKEEDISHKE